MLAGLLVVACGCARESPEGTRAAPPDTSSRQAALAVLDSLHQDVFRGAFDGLDEYAFTRHLRTAQLGAEDAPSAQRSSVVRYGYRAGRRTVQVQRTDSTGTFDFGWLGQFAENDLAQNDVASMGRHVIDEEPPFLAERSREAFSYWMIGDTLLGNRRARVIAIQTRPDAEGEQAVNRARLYVSQAGDQLVGVRLIRQSHSLLLSEKSHLAALLQPMDTTWVPAQTRFTAHLDIPLFGKRAFRTSSRFSNYAAIHPSR